MQAVFGTQRVFTSSAISQAVYGSQHTFSAWIQFVRHFFHDWNQDPFSRGAYTYVGVGGFDAHTTLAAPVDDTLFFAGEATMGCGLNATMDGAVLSGIRAATEVLEASPAR